MLLQIFDAESKKNKIGFFLLSQVLQCAFLAVAGLAVFNDLAMGAWDTPKVLLGCLYPTSKKQHKPESEPLVLTGAWVA